MRSGSGIPTAETIAIAALLAATTTVLFAEPAAAHQKSTSYSSWTLSEKGARATARISQLDLSRLGLAFQGGGQADPVAEYLADGLAFSAGGARCQPSRPAPREGPEGWAVYGWRVVCDEAGARSLETSLLLEAAPSHLHFARVTLPSGRVVERVLTGSTRAWALPSGAIQRAPDSAGTSFIGYVTLGVEHILTGWDHLAFVVALLLLAGTLGEVAMLVTAFTVAHSVTLGLATLGLVQPAAHAVEALIGFSIALVAAENGWLLADRNRWVPWTVALGLVVLALVPGVAVAPGALLGLALFSLCHFGLLRRSRRPARLRSAVAFAFGLVHGFGFAGILAELELPRARLVPALLGFNVGVELGQLGFVLLVWPLLRGLERLAAGRPARLVAEAGSAAICGLGLYWFLVRSLG